MGESLTVRDLDILTSWHSDWNGLRVAVFGAGATGFAVADTLIELGADVLVVAGTATVERADLLELIGARLILTPDDIVPRALVDFAADVAVTSPGFPPDHPLIAFCGVRGIPIWCDIELAWRLRDKSGTPAEWIAVTGTNGKTTTVQLAAHLLRAAGRNAVGVGNIGVPVLDAVRSPERWDVLVVELSSFQLARMPRSGHGAIAPIASVCLNVADDHLDWHGSLAAYIDAKATAYANTKTACVFNRADLATRRMVEDATVLEGCRAIGFGLDAPGPGELGVVGDLLVDRAYLPDRHRSAHELSTKAELDVLGLSSPHIVEDILAASALAGACGVTTAQVAHALATFRLDHHRGEIVARLRGITWVDNSKATNPHAAASALSAYRPVVWILGGLLKGTDLSALIAGEAERLRGAVLIGSDRQPLVEAFARHAPGIPVIEVVSTETESVMSVAVQFAARLAQEGDTVLLAPAAASMDQFVDYADRGARFVSAVLAQGEEAERGESTGPSIGHA